MARLDAASICSNIGLVIIDNMGTIHVWAEKYVNDKIIPKFKMKNDGSEIHLEEKFDGKNGFGGTVNHTAVCEISKDKKLLAISVE